MKKLAFLIGVLVLVIGYGGARPSAAPAPAAGPAPGQVAYIQTGNLWVRSLPDGQARQLTQDGGYSSPSWSPSGNWLLVRRGDQFWSISTGGQSRHQLPIGGRNTFAVWSPRVDRVAYRPDTEQIRLIDPDGSEEQTLVTAGPNEHITRLAWSPDGQYIGYDLNQRGPSPLSATAGLYRVSAAGGQQPEKLYEATGNGPQCLILAGWTPDGMNLLYWPQPGCSASLLADGTSLMALPVSGGAPRELGVGMLTHPDFLALSKNGKLAVANGGGRISFRMKRIAVAQSVPGEAREVSPAGMAAISPAWAPDGSRLAFTAAPETTANVWGGEQAKAALQGRHLWVANADGSGLRQVTTDPAYRDESPHWTNDGQLLLFARLANTDAGNGAPDRSGAASLWLVPAAGGSPAQVAGIDAPAGQWFGFYGWLDWASVYGYWAGPQ